MSIQFTCDDKQTLISYLYGEIDHDTRQAVDAHLAACAACAAEVTSLGDARSELGLWVPPEVELDFAGEGVDALEDEGLDSGEHDARKDT